MPTTQFDKLRDPHPVGQPPGAVAEPAPPAEVVPVPLATVDEELRFRWVNDALAHSLGRTAAELIGVSWYELCPSAVTRREIHREWFRGEFDHAQLGALALEFGEGLPRYAHVRVQPLASPSGRIERLLVVAGDDTERVVEREATAAELAASRRRLDVALAGARVGVWTLDGPPDQRVVHFDEGCAWLAGLEGAQRIAFRDFEGAVHASDRPAVRAWIEALRASPDTWKDVEYRHHLADRRWRWHLLRGCCYSSPAAPDEAAITGIVVDITACKAVEDALRTSESRYRALARMTRGYVYEGVAGPDGRVEVVWADAEFLATFGCDVAEFNRRGWLSFVDPVDRPAVLRRARALAGGHPTNAEVRIVDAAGRGKWLRIANEPLLDSETGELRRVIGMGEDVSARKRLDDELLAAATREQQRIAGDLHDGLGQLLIGISLLLRGLQNDLHRGNGSAAVRDLEQVIDLVGSAIETTRGLARGLTPVTLDAGGLVSALAELARRAGALYRLDVRLEVDAAIRVGLDAPAADHLYRIAQEAVTNVARHAAARGAVLRLTAVDDLLELVVDDDGGGFAPGRATDGMGVRLMTHRAALIGGELAVGPGPTGGTRVRCRVPNGLPGERAPPTHAER